MIWLRQLGHDAGFALRMLRRSPGFTGTVILTLALGIGMTSAVFSVFNAVLLRPLAYPNPERLLWLTMVDTEFPVPRETVLGPDFMAWTALDPVVLAPAIRKSLSDIDRTLPVFDVQTLEQVLADSITPRRFNLFLLTVFAAAALGLALIGVYGVIAHSVSQRTHEIGIRMALGADRRDVVTMVGRQGVGMALAGIVAGVAAATLLTRLMASLLYDVRPTDLQTFAIAAVGLTLTALTASLVPALRAARIDPAETLR